MLRERGLKRIGRLFHRPTKSNRPRGLYRARLHVERLESRIALAWLGPVGGEPPNVEFDDGGIISPEKFERIRGEREATKRLHEIRHAGMDHNFWEVLQQVRDAIADDRLESFRIQNASVIRYTAAGELEATINLLEMNPENEAALESLGVRITGNIGLYHPRIVAWVPVEVVEEVVALDFVDHLRTPFYAYAGSRPTVTPENAFQPTEDEVEDSGAVQTPPAPPEDVESPDESPDAAPDAPAAPPMPEGDWVKVRLEATDLQGNPVERVAVGEEFYIQTYVSDIRPEPLGVFASYLDLLQKGKLAEPRGVIEFGDPSYIVESGEADGEGDIDEAGALLTMEHTGGEEQLLVRVRYEAVAPGDAAFLSDPADQSPIYDTLIFGFLKAVPAERIDFGSLSLRVTPSKSPAAILLSTEASGAQETARPMKAAPDSPRSATAYSETIDHAVPPQRRFSPNLEFFGDDALYYHVGPVAEYTRLVDDLFSEIESEVK